jgi:hypothetical protein
VRIKDFDADAIGHDVDMKHLLDTGKVRNCQVCALGSALLSYVRLFNNVRLQDGHDYVAGTKIAVHRDSTNAAVMLTAGRGEDLLGPIFGKKQLNLIEAVFEGHDGNSELTSAEAAQATKFSKRYDDSAKCLAAIMRNVVKNGKFVLAPAKRKAA